VDYIKHADDVIVDDSYTKANKPDLDIRRVHSSWDSIVLIKYCIENNIYIGLLNTNLMNVIDDIYYTTTISYIKSLNFKFTRSYIKRFEHKEIIIFCKKNILELFL